MSDVVHVVNGHATAEPLEEAELPGEVVVWADSLDQGPLLAGAFGEDDQHRAARAGFLAGHGGADAAATAAQLAGWDAAVDRAAQEAEEVVLWYEHDLFDQLALVRLVARMTARPRKAALSMVSIDHHPEVPDWKGLGDLEAPQLAGLCAPDPRGVFYLARRTRALPFLGPALWRWLEELPAVGTGLSRTEAELLRAVHRGAGTVAAVMTEMHASDRVYLATDTLVARTAERLAAIGALTGGFGAGAPALTPLGEELWKGRRDRVAELGIDDWRGGVRLSGRGAMWRWDAGTRRPVVA
jgi:hypothetical protein